MTKMMMMMMMTVTTVVMVISREATASDVKDLDAHIDDGGLLVLFLSCSI